MFNDLTTLTLLKQMAQSKDDNHLKLIIDKLQLNVVKNTSWVNINPWAVVY